MYINIRVYNIIYIYIYMYSGRTGNILLHPSHSSIRLHVESRCDVNVKTVLRF